MPDTIAGMQRYGVGLAQTIAAHHPEDPQIGIKARDAIFQLMCIEIEVMLSQVRRSAAARRARGGWRRPARSATWSARCSTMRSPAQSRCANRPRARPTSPAACSARHRSGSGGRAVGAGMRDAAQTAAGLIRAIEEARGEVETAALVATRAAEQSAAAVTVSGALSDHAKAIESILG
jgi:methyl-accepting chemotaxis protein